LRCRSSAACRAALADAMDDASAAFLAKDHEKAAAIWRAQADKGDPAAQNNLGEMFFNGLGVARSDTEAVRWYRRAAGHKGHYKAQVVLIGLYAEAAACRRTRSNRSSGRCSPADRGHEGARKVLPAYEKMLSGTQVEKARADAAAWQRQFWGAFQPAAVPLPGSSGGH